MTATTSSRASRHSPSAENEPAAHSRVVPPITLPHLAGIDLADGFTKPWKPVRRSPAYAASIAVVSLLMLVVPALYLSLVGAIGLVTYWHAVHHFHWLGDAFSGSHSRGAVRLSIIVAGVIYFAPLLAGLVLLLLVLRPVLLSGGRSSQHFTIEPAEEPALHAFVSALCRYIGAPEPRRIDIDSSVNASASFRRGWLSLLSRGDLVLTIGTPLIAGMNVTQFAGILAHEFGHFTQGAAMRGTYVIDSINRWLARIVYERTNAEAAIAQFAREQTSAWATVAHLLVSIGAWITRMFFKVLLYAAHAISCIMARRMEFDADRHQARLIGAEEFSKAWRRMLELEEGNRAAFRDLSEYFRQNQLPDDLASLVQSCSRRLGSDAAHRIGEQLSDFRTPLLATHPSIASRIAAAERGDESPSFTCDQPATILFRNFDDVSKKASYAQYKHEIGGALFTMTLVPTQTLLKSYAQLEQHSQELAKYVGFPPADWRPLFLGVSTIAPTENPKETFLKLRAARGRSSEMSAAATAAAAEYLKADATLVRCEQASAWHSLGRGATPRKFELGSKGPGEIARIKEQATDAAANAAAILDEAAEYAMLRLSCSLRILHTKGSESRIENAARLRERSSQLVAVMATLRQSLPRARDIRVGLRQAEMLQPALAQEKGRDQVKKIVRPISDAVRDRLDDARRELGAAIYPFDNPTGTMTLAHRIIGDSPAWRDFDAIFSAAETLVGRYPAECRLVLAELVSIALKVEASLTSKPREEPRAEAS